MFSVPDLLQNLVNLGERQGVAEANAASLICTELRTADIRYEEQSFELNTPKVHSAMLIVDGKAVDCAATCFSSGNIENKEVILSSAMPMAESPDLPNINFNPYCSVVSKANHYRQPAIAVSHEMLGKILNGKRVYGEVSVSMERQEARNIIIGNTLNPTIAIFTHYDSIGPGANDNASGSVAVLQALLADRSLQEKAVCILSGAEELSDELPYYWGAGYRRFQERYTHILENIRDIFVVDSIGNGTVETTNDPRIVRRAFPLKNMETLLPKIRLISGSLEALMPVYHSQLDKADTISYQSISAASDMLAKLCK